MRATTRSVNRFQPPSHAIASAEQGPGGPAVLRLTAPLREERRPRTAVLSPARGRPVVIAPRPMTPTMIGAGRSRMRPATVLCTIGHEALTATGPCTPGPGRASRACLPASPTRNTLGTRAGGVSGHILPRACPEQSLPLAGTHVTPIRGGQGAPTGPRGNLATVPAAMLHPLPSGGPAGSMLLPRVPLGTLGAPRGSPAFELTRHPQEGNSTVTGHTMDTTRIRTGPGVIGHPRR